MDFPVACSLMPAELHERRLNVLSKIRDSVSSVTEVEHGFVYHFSPDNHLISELASLIQLERECCPFLTFRLTIEQGNGPVSLEMAGPDKPRALAA